MKTTRKFTDEQEQEICSRYLAGESTVAIGDFFGTGNSSIGRILRRNGVKARGTGAARKLTAEQEQEICQRYSAGEGSIQLGDVYGVSGTTILNIITRYGIKARSSSEYQRKLTDAQEQVICRRYLAGESRSQLGEAYGVSDQCIGAAIKRNGIKIRSGGESQRKFTAEQELEICQRYLEGESSKQLADAYETGPNTILSAIKRNGVKARSGSEAFSGAARVKASAARRSLSPEQEIEVCRLYESGQNQAQISKLYGVTAGPIRRALVTHGIPIRSISLTKGGLNADQQQEVCRRYLAGETTVELAEAFGVNNGTIGRYLRCNGINARSRVESRGGLTDEQIAEVCNRYQQGENTVQLMQAYGVTHGTIGNYLKRNGIELRGPDGYGDSVQHAIDGTGRHANPRESAFYIYELARYSDTHCKPGIAFDAGARAQVGYAEGEYGEEVLRLLFTTRTETYFLEQAVLDATRGCADCPDDLLDWHGRTEVRAMPAADLLPIALRLADELEDLGPWEFAARYVPMTAAQRIQCQQRAMQLQEVA